MPDSHCNGEDRGSRSSNASLMGASSMVAEPFVDSQSYKCRYGLKSTGLREVDNYGLKCNQNRIKIYVHNIIDIVSFLFRFRITTTGH